MKTIKIIKGFEKDTHLVYFDSGSVYEFGECKKNSHWYELLLKCITEKENETQTS